MHAEQVHTLVLDFVRNLHPDVSEPSASAGATLDELGVDSMSLVDLLFRLEREYDVTIPDEALPNIATVGDLVEYVTARKAGTAR
jgi:acyl carrier protein